MYQFLLGRSAQLVGTLLIMSAIVFVLIRLSGSPLEAMLPEDAPQETRDAVSRAMGLDRPIFVQYALYIGAVVRGDFGTSFRTRAPVSEVIRDRLPATAQLAAAALFLTFLVAIPLGVLAGVRQGTWVDVLARSLAFLGQSIPNFWLGILLIRVVSMNLPFIPIGGRESPYGIVLPAVTMSWFTMAGIIRILRSSVLEVLRSDYIRTARAKGLRRSAIIRGHVLQNAMLPVVTFSGIVVVQAFLAGTVVIETVFTWPGIGRLLYEAILWRDFPVVQGLVLLFTTGYVMANMALDLIYTRIDPRIRLR